MHRTEADRAGRQVGDRDLADRAARPRQLLHAETHAYKIKPSELHACRRTRSGRRARRPATTGERRRRRASHRGAAATGEPESGAGGGGARGAVGLFNAGSERGAELVLGGRHRRRARGGIATRRSLRGSSRTWRVSSRARRVRRRWAKLVMASARSEELVAGLVERSSRGRRSRRRRTRRAARRR